MTLPATVTVTISNELNAALAAQEGEIDFAPSNGIPGANGIPGLTPVTGAGNQLLIAPIPVPVPLNPGESSSIDLVPTDTAGLNPPGWMYLVTTRIPSIAAYWNLYFIPSSPDPVDLSELTPLIPPTAADMVAYLLLTGGTVTGPVTLTGSPPLKVPGAAAGEVLTSDSGGNFTPQVPETAPVTSVNGDTGIVVLTAASVGADTSGSAATAQTAAESFATAAIASQGLGTAAYQPSSAFDAAGAAASAQSNAETYAAAQATAAQGNAEAASDPAGTAAAATAYSLRMLAV